jgi:hypothetical protein
VGLPSVARVAVVPWSRVAAVVRSVLPAHVPIPDPWLGAGLVLLTTPGIAGPSPAEEAAAVEARKRDKERAARDAMMARVRGSGSGGASGSDRGGASGAGGAKAVGGAATGGEARRRRFSLKSLVSLVSVLTALSRTSERAADASASDARSDRGPRGRKTRRTSAARGQSEQPHAAGEPGAEGEEGGAESGQRGGARGAGGQRARSPAPARASPAPPPAVRRRRHSVGAAIPASDSAVREASARRSASGASPVSGGAGDSADGKEALDDVTGLHGLDAPSRPTGREHDPPATSGASRANARRHSFSGSSSPDRAPAAATRAPAPAAAPVGAAAPAPHGEPAHPMAAHPPTESPTLQMVPATQVLTPLDVLVGGALMEGWEHWRGVRQQVERAKRAEAADVDMNALVDMGAGDDGAGDVRASGAAPARGPPVGTFTLWTPRLASRMTALVETEVLPRFAAVARGDVLHAAGWDGGVAGGGGGVDVDTLLEMLLHAWWFLRLGTYAPM